MITLITFSFVVHTSIYLAKLLPPYTHSEVDSAFVYDNCQRCWLTCMACSILENNDDSNDSNKNSNSSENNESNNNNNVGNCKNTEKGS